MGGFIWDQKIGFLGTLAPRPDARSRKQPWPMDRWRDPPGTWREGVDREGKALFQIMPYSHLRSMSDEERIRWSHTCGP